MLGAIGPIKVHVDLFASENVAKRKDSGPLFTHLQEKWATAWTRIALAGDMKGVCALLQGVALKLDLTQVMRAGPFPDILRDRDRYLHLRLMLYTMEFPASRISRIPRTFSALGESSTMQPVPP